jgi:aspartate-semialdehyde dehydrogenase
MFVQLLDGHPWFEITALAASARSAGQRYHDAVTWIGDRPLPEAVADMVVQPTEPGLDCDFVFSGLSSSVAGEVERAFAEAGYPVVSNARNYRMKPDVPLLIPEINADHTALIDRQVWNEGEAKGGYIVTNPNCSTVGLVCALKPLVEAFGIEAVQVTTLQALSGAGHPGVPSLDILGNVIPYIGGEEEKMALEPRKILGRLTDDGQIEEADMAVSAQCNRVPVKHGHMECVSVKLAAPASADDVRAAIAAFTTPEAVRGLPSAPDPFLHLDDDPFFPQPARHVERGGGMTVSVGRVRPCEVMDVKLVALSHNTVRGAAGGAILNAEILVEQGRLAARTTTPRPATA